jgi:transcriptional regulator with XRE-family HTH domain
MIGATVIEFGAATLPRVQQLRNAMRMTQQQLADRIGVDRLTIRRWERGAIRIPPAYRFELGELFGVSVDHLMRVPWQPYGRKN